MFYLCSYELLPDEHKNCEVMIYIFSIFRRKLDNIICFFFIFQLADNLGSWLLVLAFCCSSLHHVDHRHYIEGNFCISYKINIPCQKFFLFIFGWHRSPIEGVMSVSEWVSESVSEPLFTMFPLEDLYETYTVYVSWIYVMVIAQKVKGHGSKNMSNFDILAL